MADELTPEQIAVREAEWAEGTYTNSKGVQTKLADLPAPHLQNAINKYAETHDVSALETELKGRTQN